MTLLLLVIVVVFLILGAVTAASLWIDRDVDERDGE